ncbi:uncharacterized protein B0T15DRAFT_504255 [Chaetomium strumarium]|uniref:Uncharacterized protein n=1 Tax=Chaetomium strumarium TaxID=1170767 RepID=A0AAJ0LZ31_9PEZI|nr:hypothetical protein B0T15DRAFT_504255 [Chaetomium strumarium]
MATLAEPEELEVSIVKESQISPPKETPKVPKVPKEAPKVAKQSQKKQASTKMKATKKAQAPAQPTVKRPRGRPRKPRNNTVDTAIVLSDDDDDDDDDDDNEEDDDAMPKKVLWDTKKRSLGKVESPASAPSAKRRAADSSSLRAELDELKEELASERELLSDARAEKSRLAHLLEEKEASWGAELAVQMAPFQLQIQKLVQEREALESKCQSLQQQLDMALGGCQEDQDPDSALSDDLTTRVQQQRGIIATQSKEIADLEELEEEREKEVAEAHQKIALLTQTVRELTAQHEGSSKLPHEQHKTIQQLQDDLAQSEMLRSQAEESLHATTKKLGQVEEELTKSERKLPKLTKQLAGDEVDNTEDVRAAVRDEMETEAKRLVIENTRLLSLVTELQKEKLELTEAYGEEGNLLNQLHAYKDSVEALRAEKAQLLSSLDSANETIAGLKQDLERHIAASKQKVASIVAQSEHERACQNRQFDETIAQLQLDLAEKSSDNKQLREALANAQKDAANHHNIEQMNQEVASQSHMLANIQDAAKECRTRMETRSDVVITALRDRVTNLTADITKSEKTSAALHAHLQRRHALITGTEQTISAEKAAIRELRNIASALPDEEKANLQDRIAAHETKLRELTLTTLPDLTTGILKTKTLADTQTNTINSMQAELNSISRGRDYVAQEIAARLATVKRLKAHLARASQTIDRIAAAARSLYLYPRPRPESDDQKTLLLITDVLREKDETTALLTALETEFRALRSKSAAAVVAINSSIVDLPHRLNILAAEAAGAEKLGQAQRAEVEKLRAELARVMALVEKLRKEVVVATVAGKGDGAVEMKEDRGDASVQDKGKGIWSAWMKR